MRKRLLKKYLAAFNCTLKSGNVVGSKPLRRHPSHWYLPQNHPLTVRRTNKSYREQARVLPALLKASIRDVLKASFARRVAERGPATQPVRPEHGGRPRQRLLSAVIFFVKRASAKGLTDKQYLAALDAGFTALLRERPQVLGKRLQSGNRVTS
jgi:hypothetical protein